MATSAGKWLALVGAAHLSKVSTCDDTFWGISELTGAAAVLVKEKKKKNLLQIQIP